MYLWKLNKLTKDLKNNKVTEDEKYKYFLVMSIIGIIGVGGTGYINREVNTLNIIDSLFVIIGYILAIIIIHKKNKSGDNKNFIDRYVCLSLPAFIKAFVYSLVITLPLGVIAGVMDGATGGTKYVNLLEIASIIIGWIFLTIIVNFLIYKSISIISKK